MYNQQTADKVCERLAAGESLRKACANEGTTPWSILRWADANESFSQQYARARDIGYKLLAEDLLEIADEGRNDTYTDDNGNERTDQDVIARSRLRVDTRKWMLSKMLPKIYGEKLETTHKGGVSLTLPITEADGKL